MVVMPTGSGQSAIHQIDTLARWRELLRRYIGDHYEPPSGNCGRCEETGQSPANDIPVDPSAGTRREVA